MRPLPRLLALTDDRVATLDDLGVRAAAIAAVGNTAGLVARLPGGSADALTALAGRFVALARPPEAPVFVTGRADVALVTGANGVILRRDDLDAATVRALFAACHRTLWIARSVRSLAEAQSAAAEGVDALIAGSIWPTATHPERQPAGIEVLRQIVALGVPTYAIGGVNVERMLEARAAGAWGVAAIRSVWDDHDSYRAAMSLAGAGGSA